MRSRKVARASLRLISPMVSNFLLFTSVLPPLAFAAPPISSRGRVVVSWGHSPPSLNTFTNYP
ncbi:BQ5605_C008g05388 [Microbotryum silenes-dioicae]|uniref:BQ5605_C008g05388 protein n=1 Tax=Microbotryum silenes-dioicae TaxID=796604 RepID=A0A2X0PF86_9BASI|nr:BQ5605_C008g05388 [Microbotryum silenes-dioicae]